jgi:hypothetical protein
MDYTRVRKHNSEVVIDQIDDIDGDNLIEPYG